MPDELERLRSLLARAHEPENPTSVRKLLLEMAKKFVPPTKQPEAKDENAKKNPAA